MVAETAQAGEISAEVSATASVLEPPAPKVEAAPYGITTLPEATAPTEIGAAAPVAPIEVAVASPITPVADVESRPEALSPPVESPVAEVPPVATGPEDDVPPPTLVEWPAPVEGQTAPEEVPAPQERTASEPVTPTSPGVVLPAAAAAAAAAATEVSAPPAVLVASEVPPVPVPAPPAVAPPPVAAVAVPSKNIGPEPAAPATAPPEAESALESSWPFSHRGMSRLAALLRPDLLPQEESTDVSATNGHVNGHATEASGQETAAVPDARNPAFAWLARTLQEYQAEEYTSVTDRRVATFAREGPVAPVPPPATVLLATKDMGSLQHEMKDIIRSRRLISYTALAAELQGKLARGVSLEEANAAASATRDIHVYGEGETAGYMWQGN